MTKEQRLAYCAGYVDGDGTMFITAAKQSKGNGHYFRPTLAAVGINDKPLQRLAGMFGGEVKPAGEVLRCALHYRAAVTAAKQLEPFLLVKREQSRILQEFQGHVDLHRGARILADDVKSERFKFVTRISATNHRVLDADQFQPHRTKASIAGYVAGLLEAEGYFAVAKSAGYPAIAITVGMTDPNVIYWLKDIFGGWAGELKNRTKAGKRIFVWRVYRHEAYAVAKLIRNLLTFKKEQADLLIRYQNNVNLWKERLGGVNQYNLPAKARKQREAIALRLKSLHGRAGATTNPEQPTKVSDSLSCNDDKVAEYDGNARTAI